MEGVFYGTVTAQGVVLDQSAAYQRFAMRKFMGKPIEVVIRPKRSKRSLDQNRLWHAIVTQVASEVGYELADHDEVHYALVARHYGTHEDRINHNQVPNVRSSKLNTKQFSELIDSTVRWAAMELGLVIEMPDDLHV